MKRTLMTIFLLLAFSPVSGFAQHGPPTEGDEDYVVPEKPQKTSSSDRWDDEDLPFIEEPSETPKKYDSSSSTKNSRKADRKSDTQQFASIVRVKFQVESVEDLFEIHKIFKRFGPFDLKSKFVGEGPQILVEGIVELRRHQVNLHTEIIRSLEPFAVGAFDFQTLDLDLSAYLSDEDLVRANSDSNLRLTIIDLHSAQFLK